MHQVREFHRILNEEHRDVVADQIPVALVGVELHRESAHVARSVGRASLAKDGREAHEHRGLLAYLSENCGLRVFAQLAGALEEAVCRRAAGMNDALGDALMIEVCDLLAKDEILEQGRPAQPGLEGALVVAHWHALIGGQGALGGIDADAVERSDGLVFSDDRSTAADFVRSVLLLNRAGADDGIVGHGEGSRIRRRCRLRVILERLVRVERERGSEILRRCHLRREIVGRDRRRLRLSRAGDGRATIGIDQKRRPWIHFFVFSHSPWVGFTNVVAFWRHALANVYQAWRRRLSKHPC